MAKSPISTRSLALRSLLMAGVGLLIVSTIVAWPEFTRSESIPFAIPPFADQWHAAESPSPNFWGPALAPGAQEQYQQSPGGVRTVQYFDKARMEQTQPGGAVTNGLLTVELISGKRQFGDDTFVQFAPSKQIVVGDPTGTWPPYSALGGGVFPNLVVQSKDPIGTVYQMDGTLTTNTQVSAYPGAAFGSYERDPGGRYGHNVPLAFSAYLQKLPVPWQTAMGYPLTEAFWVNVPLNGTMTWVMVQPYERRVLSYTPTNPQGFQVEMGNIGQHYYAWRYTTDPGDINGPPPPTALSTTTACVTAAPPKPTVIRTGTVMISIPTSSGLATCVPPPICDLSTPTQTTVPTGTVFGTATFAPAPTACATGTPDASATAEAATGVEIHNLRASVTDTTFTISFVTNLPATSYIRYGTNPGSYSNAQDISTSQTTSHSTMVTGLQPDTYYYFVIRIDSTVDGFTKPEDYFLTNPSAAPASTPTYTPPPRPSGVVGGGPISGGPASPGNGGCPPSVGTEGQTSVAKTIAAQPSGTQTAVAHQTATMAANQTATIASGGKISCGR